MYLGIGKVASMIGVSISTLRRWDNANLLVASYRTVGGHRRYKLVKILLFCKSIAIKISDSNQIQHAMVCVISYARVSSSKQREDLKRQQNYLEHFVQQRHWTLLKAYQDIGSGLNDKRRSLLQMLKDLTMDKKGFKLYFQLLISLIIIQFIIINKMDFIYHHQVIIHFLIILFIIII